MRLIAQEHTLEGRRPSSKLAENSSKARRDS